MGNKENKMECRGAPIEKQANHAILELNGNAGDLGAQWQCGSNGDRESHFVDPDPSQEEHDYTHAKRGMIYSCQEGHDYLLHSPTGLIRTHLYWTDNTEVHHKRDILRVGANFEKPSVPCDIVEHGSPH